MPDFLIYWNKRNNNAHRADLVILGEHNSIGYNYDSISIRPRDAHSTTYGKTVYACLVVVPHTARAQVRRPDISGDGGAPLPWEWSVADPVETRSPTLHVLLYKIWSL